MIVDHFFVLHDPAKKVLMIGNSLLENRQIFFSHLFFQSFKFFTIHCSFELIQSSEFDSSLRNVSFLRNWRNYKTSIIIIITFSIQNFGLMRPWNPHCQCIIDIGQCKPGIHGPTEVQGQTGPTWSEIFEILLVRSGPKFSFFALVWSEIFEIVRPGKNFLKCSQDLSKGLK